MEAVARLLVAGPMAQQQVATVAEVALEAMAMKYEQDSSEDSLDKSAPPKDRRI